MRCHRNGRMRLDPTLRQPTVSNTPFDCFVSVSTSPRQLSPHHATSRLPRTRHSSSTGPSRTAVTFYSFSIDYLTLRLPRPKATAPSRLVFKIIDIGSGSLRSGDLSPTPVCGLYWLQLRHASLFVSTDEIQQLVPELARISTWPASTVQRSALVLSSTGNWMRLSYNCFIYYSSRLHSSPSHSLHSPCISHPFRLCSCSISLFRASGPLAHIRLFVL